MHPLDDPRFNTDGWHWEYSESPPPPIWILHLPVDAKINAKEGESSDLSFALETLGRQGYQVASGTVNADGSSGDNPIYPNKGGHIIIELVGEESNQAFTRHQLMKRFTQTQLQSNNNKTNERDER